MRVAVLGASGATGRLLVEGALGRGHEVVALVRTPATAGLPPDTRLTLATVDVRDPTSLAEALVGVDVLVSGLGNQKGSPPGVLTAGAEAVMAVGVPRVVWLGALGTGRSVRAAGRPTALLLRAVMGAELPDKQGADEVLLPAGATVFHSGPLTNGALSATRRTVALARYRRPWPMPRPVSRATVTALMLDEAERPGPADGEIVVPLG
jgi:uncharacterized protein